MYCLHFEPLTWLYTPSIDSTLRLLFIRSTTSEHHNIHNREVKVKRYIANVNAINTGFIYVGTVMISFIHKPVASFQLSSCD